MAQLAVSSWSLHRTLGPVYRDLALTSGERPISHPYGPGRLSLLELPAAVAELGVTGLEICHFHFPRTDDAYLALLRSRLAEAGVQLLTLLVDAGDITAADPATLAHDLASISGWIDVAARLGAQRVRVIAGDAAADPAGLAIQRSIAGFTQLVAYARERGVAIITENWRQLTLTPGPLLAILDGLHGSVGLCADFGNYRGESKYDDLAAIVPRAVAVHAKAHYPAAGVVDAADFERCLTLTRAAGFNGDYVLIFDGPGDELTSLAQMREIVRPYL